ncbi:MAG: metallophosphoesterase [Verrucomicrobiia bacterium]
MSRRAFLRYGALWSSSASLAGIGGRSLLADQDPGPPLLRIGLLTDVHYADRPPAGTRYYRESLTKLRECVAHFNETRPDFVVELGDFIDAAETVEGEIANLKTAEAQFSKLRCPRHYVLGNHCVWTLNKAQFREHSAAGPPYYSFDHGEFHFIVLDACFRADGVPYGNRNLVWTDTEIPAVERQWLEADLKTAKGKAVVFVHQRLDVENEYGVKSAAVVRRILEQSGKVLAVIQGHYHKNDYREINGIHYCTLAAMIEGTGAEQNAYSLLSLFRGGSLKLEGFHRQASYRWAGD